MERSVLENVGSCYLATFNCCDKNIVTKVTYKRKDLFGLIALERWESIMVGKHGRRSRLLQDAKKSHDVSRK